MSHRPGRARLDAQAQSGAGAGGTAIWRTEMSGVRAVSRLLGARRLALTRAVSRCRGWAGRGGVGGGRTVPAGRSGRRFPPAPGRAGEGLRAVAGRRSPEGWGRPSGQPEVFRSPPGCVPVKVMTPRSAPGPLPPPGIQAWGLGASRKSVALVRAFSAWGGVFGQGYSDG